jgi:hypothetical protein
MRYFVPLLLTLSAGIASAQPAAIVVQEYTYAPVGIAAGTTLRLNVANITNGGTTACTGNLSYVNSDGTTIKAADFTANPGQTSSYPLLITDVTGSPASAEVRGVVKINRQVGGVVGQPIAPSCSAVMSLEIVDIATGQTRAVLTSPTPITGGFAIPLPVVGTAQ